MAPMPDPPLVLIDVLEEHLEELDLLWETRQRALDSPDYTPASFAALEERMAAHFEGLRVGGDHSLRIARYVLPRAKGSTAFAAAFALLTLGGPDDAMAVIDTLRSGEAEVADGLRHALRHAGSARVVEGVRELLGSAPWPARVAALDVLSFRRIDPGVDPHPYLHHEDSWVRRVAWGALARLRPSLVAADLTAGFEDAEPLVARAALEAASLMGRREVIEWCRAGCRRLGAQDRWAAVMLGALGEPSDVGLLIETSGKPPVQDAAILGIGYLGDPHGVPRLIEAMGDPALLVAGGEAFRQITGADIDAREERRADEGEAPPIGDPAEFLPERPTPEPARAQAFWKQRASKFSEGQRYRFGVRLGGKDVQPPDLQGRWHAALRASVSRGAPPPPAQDPERFALP